MIESPLIIQSIWLANLDRLLGREWLLRIQAV